ncbi:hypothetical protein AB0D10_13560 [Kitasatospora sp. NPDC048545]
MTAAGHRAGRAQNAYLTRSQGACRSISARSSARAAALARAR